MDGGAVFAAFAIDGTGAVLSESARSLGGLSLLATFSRIVELAIGDS